jgi:hypothetical protein
LCPINHLVFSQEELMKALKTIKSKHCHGFNGIPLRIAKDFSTTLPQMALRYYNTLAKEGLTDDQRTARVIPLHKKGSRTEISNYRPIANLCSLSKVYEKLLYQRLLIETKGLEGLYQHGFRMGHSTTTALLQIQTIISKHLEGGKMCLGYSVDLSAAFDVFRPDIFLKMYKGILSHGLAHSIADFLYNRMIACDVKGAKSTVQKMPIGCVQGSTLGPRLFSLYMGRLADQLQHHEIVGFADDTYVIIEGDSIEELKTKTSEISQRHVDYLEALGMVVNKSKTEVVIFDKDPIITEITFAGTEVKSVSQMKALGVILAHNLKWDQHLNTILPKSNAKLSLLRKIRPVITQSQFLQIATSQVLSTTYYAAPVWLNSTLGCGLWKKIESLHYRIMRVACNDFKRRRRRKEIDIQCKRATPKMWSYYVSASTAMKIIRDAEPKLLARTIETNMVTERRRPRNGRFFDSSRVMIGRHQFSNRLGHLNSIPDPWLYPSPSNDSIRTMLKRHLNFDFKT